ncbi:MAG TPA: PA0069 family radical SAM protein, partial [Planctomycetota bacterium]|nr:PA0069 family radical SAM protein [Planctomycetota bacterium]
MNPARGRGSAENPKNRFEEIELTADPEAPEDAISAPATKFYRDESKSVISTNDSPDVGFSASVNPYRGCEHGCVYCYARPTHEYLGFSAGLDFESKIMVKRDAPALVRKELESPSWKPQVVVMSGVTDCYQPVERRLRLTRGCLEIFAEFRNPVSIVTKNHLVTRDADLLSELARHRAAAVFVSVTTLDGDLARAMEPRASTPSRRLAAITALASAGVPVGVLIAPVIPGLTEHEIPAILSAAAKAGARHAG